MDTDGRARAAAHEVLEDIEPQQLRKVLFERLAEASMAPSVLVFLSAQASQPAVDLDELETRAAGVQLIYEGLRLTRRIAHDEPWADTNADVIDADVDILAADVFVSRGFYLLARTEASTAAVETVQSFGRDQTIGRRADSNTASLDRNLEADIFALAVRAGVTAVGVAPSPELLSFAVDLAPSENTGFASTDSMLSDTTVRRLSELSSGVDGRVRSSASEQ